MQDNDSPDKKVLKTPPSLTTEEEHTQVVMMGELLFHVTRHKIATYHC